jgi:6,7-dimethyl-8-ribityllumazine synthase
MSDKPHILIIEARFYEEISDMLLAGAVEAIEDAGCTYETIEVPGALEMPLCMKYACEAGEYDAVVALGAVIRGETTHYDIVSEDSCRGLMQISLDYSMPFGNGIQTCENMEQTIARADKNQKNKGGGAARAALRMLEIENQMYPKIMANYEALTDAHNDDMTEMEAAS